MSDLDDLTIVSGVSRQQLNQRQLVDYRSQRTDCLNWLLHFDKNPDRTEGYALETVRARANRMDMFYRWVWNQEDRYVADVTHDHADAYMKHLAYKDTSNVDKANHQKAVKMLFKWRDHEHGLAEWTPSITFSTSESASQPLDFFTLDEDGGVKGKRQSCEGAHVVGVVMC